MLKKKEYYVPIEFTMINILIIEAPSQTEAIAITKDLIEKSEKANVIYDTFNILESDITCNQDDEMFDELAKDFKLEVKEEEHPVVAGIDEDTENKDI